jgi:hypothetical protein
MPGARSRCAASRSTSIRFAARAAPELRRGNRQPLCGVCRAVRRGVRGTGCAEPDRDRRSDPHRDRGHDRCGEVAKGGRRAAQSRATGIGSRRIGPRSSGALGLSRSRTGLTRSLADSSSARCPDGSSAAAVLCRRQGQAPLLDLGQVTRQHEQLARAGAGRFKWLLSSQSPKASE